MENNMSQQEINSLRNRIQQIDQELEESPIVQTGSEVDRLVIERVQLQNKLSKAYGK